MNQFRANFENKFIIYKDTIFMYFGNRGLSRDRVQGQKHHFTFYIESNIKQNYFA